MNQDDTPLSTSVTNEPVQDIPVLASDGLIAENNELSNVDDPEERVRLLSKSLQERAKEAIEQSKQQKLVMKKLISVGVVPVLVALLFLGSAAAVVYQSRNKVNLSTSNQPIIKTDTSKLPAVGELNATTRQIVFNKTVVANGGLVVSPSIPPTNVTAGQLYFDEQDSLLRIYDGSAYRSLVSLKDDEQLCYVGADCGFVTRTELNTVRASLNTLPSSSSLGVDIDSSEIVNGTILFADIGQNGCLNNEVIAWNGSSWTCSAAGSTPGAFVQGGNSFGSAAVIGTIDNNSLVIQTNNQTAVTIDSGGAVTLQNATNSASAFNVRNAAGSTILSVDTVDQTVTTADLLPVTSGSITAGYITSTIVSADYVENPSQKQIILGVDSLPRIVYADNGSADLHYVRCHDVDCQSATNTVIASVADWLTSATITRGADGFSRIIYISFDTPNEIHYVQCTNDNCTTNSNQVVGTPSSGYNLGFALGLDGFARIVYYDDDTGENTYVQCTNNDCSTYSTALLPNIGVSNFGVTFAADGFARIAYFDDANKEIDYIQCTNDDCSSYNLSSVASSFGVSGYNIDIEQGQDGYSRIAYGDPDGNGLRLITCADDSCYSFTNNLVDAAVTSSNQVSLNIDNNGFVRIAYQLSPSNSGVGYAICSDASCSTASISSLATSGGQTLSMVTGSNNLSTVMYVNGSGNDVLFTRLLSPDGNYITTEGNSIGSSSAYYGQTYLQGINLQSSSASALLSLDQYHNNGGLIDFSFKGVQVASLGITATSLQFSDTNSVPILGINSDARAIDISADLNVVGNVQANGFVDIIGDIAVSGTSEVNGVLITNGSYTTNGTTTLNGNVVVQSATNSTTAFLLQNSSGSSVMQIDARNKALIVGTATDSNDISYNQTISGFNMPYSLDAADYNNDGLNDMAVLNYATSSVSIVINNGNGTFATKVDYSVGSLPYELDSADINNDGYVDIVVAAWLSDSMSVLLNNGNGTFSTFGSYSTGTSSRPTSISTGDFNGDGYADVVVGSNAGFGSGQASVFMNNGNGTFAARVNYAVPNSAVIVRAADLNADGYADIAAVDSYNLYVYMNNGDGTFAAYTPYSLSGGGPNSLSTGDIDNDGYEDLIVSTYSSSIVSVFINNGDGTLAPRTDYAAGSNPNYVNVADIDLDGHLDVATSGQFSGSISILFNNGDGTLEGKTDYYVGYTPRSISISNFFGDNRREVAVADSATNVVIFGLQNNLNVVEPPMVKLYSKGNDAIRVEGLGNKQIFRVDGQGNATIGGTQSIDKGNMFADKVDYATNGSPTTITSADFDQDGYSDVAVVSEAGNTLSVYINNGDGTFAAKVDYTASGSSWGIDAADVNNDGYTDILTTGFYTSKVSVFINNGNGTFAARVDYNTGAYPTRVSAADFNLDGFMDLVVSNQGSGTASVLINNGDGTFAAKVDYATGAQAGGITSYDVNNDGYPDVQAVYSNYVAVLINNGDGTFAAKVDYASSSSLWSVAGGDFNGDGFMDLAVAGSNAVSVLTNNGNGTFAANIDYAAGSNSFRYGLVASDYNNDGHIDLAVSSYGYNTVSMYINNGEGTFTDKVDYVAGTRPMSIAASDYNNDGFVDVAVVNNNSSTFSVLMNKYYVFSPAGRLTVYNTTGTSQIFNVGLSGDVLLKNSSDSVSAFLVQNAAGNSLLAVDTLNSKVTVKSSTNNTAAFNVQNASSIAIFGVDTQNSAIVSAIEDGETAIGFKLNVTNSYVTGGAKLLSVQNNGTERFAIDKDGHIVSASPAPTAVTINANAGVGGSPSCTVAGNETAGTVTIVTGTGAQIAGVWCTATISFNNIPRPVVSPLDQASAALMPYMNADESSFTLGVNATGSVGTTYKFNYFMPM